MNHPTQIPEIQLIVESNHSKGALYISNLSVAQDISTLNRLQIYSIITVAKNCILYHPFLNSSNYLLIPAQDVSAFNLGQYFDKTYNFIQQQRDKTNVLVHCDTGISRSATIILAYLMKRMKMKFIEAYFLVRRKRSIIQPNPGFIFQLYEYEAKLTELKSNLQNYSVSVKKENRANIKQDKKVQINSNFLAKGSKSKKSILSSGKNLIKKKVSFKLIDDNEQQKEQDKSRQVSLAKTVNENKGYNSIKDQLRDLKQNINIMKQRLNEKKKSQLRIRDNLDKIELKRTLYF